MRQTTKTALALAVGAAVLLAAWPLQAQNAGRLKQQFAEAQQQNKEALRSYTWKSRTEIRLKGESKNVKLEQVRYDLDGNLQKTEIGGTGEQQQQESASGRRRRGGRVKERIVKKKTAELTEEMQTLGALVASYGQLSAEEMQAFAASATVGEGEGELAGTVRIDGGAIKQPGDEMTIWIDPQTFMMGRLQILTFYEDNDVRLITEFRSVVDGPTYQARTTLQYPERELELIVENFDYEAVERQR